MEKNIDLLHSIFTNPNIIGVALDFERGYKFTIYSYTSSHGSKLWYQVADGSHGFNDDNNTKTDEIEVLEFLKHMYENIEDEYYKKYPPKNLCESCKKNNSTWKFTGLINGKKICTSCLDEYMKKNNFTGYSQSDFFGEFKFMKPQINGEVLEFDKNESDMIEFVRGRR